MSTSALSPLWNLQWTAPSPPYIPLPDSIKRTFVQGPPPNHYDLELLSAIPNKSPAEPPAFTSPILFVHGGFGSASVYIPFLLHLSHLGYSAHALSLRGHGHSTYPGYLKMVYWTTAEDLALDVARGVEFLEKMSAGKGNVVLVGHSSGGGLVQMCCDREYVKAKALILLAGTPSFGADYVYRSWWKLDPWFVPRMFLRHLGHPRSPLSTPQLVKNVFFSPSFPLSEVETFAHNMAPYESLLWPLGIMFNGYVDLHRVLLGCNMKILVVAGQKDVLMRTEFMERTAAEYTIALGECERDGLKEEGERGRVDYEVVDDSGHHVMNDSMWKDAADILAEWFEVLADDWEIEGEEEVPGLIEARRKQGDVY